MRYLILTSSIFFLLGLKITNNIEPNQKMETDSVHITIPETKVLPSNEEKKELKTEPVKEKDPAGSGKLTAPKPVLSTDKAQ
jgi:hypothetical protein